MPNKDGKTPQQRFAERYTVDLITGCWNWTAGKDGKGYGVISVNGKATFAHRFSYELTRGPIPTGLTIDHLCRNRACVNPDHMEPISLIQNVMRGASFSAINARKSNCPAGHPYQGENLVSNKKNRRICKICEQARQRIYDKTKRKRNRN